MLWPTFEQAVVATVGSLVAMFVLRRRRPTRITEFLLPALREFAILSALYALWRTAKKLPLTQTDGAIERAVRIVEVQDAMGLPSELVVQQWVLDRGWLGWLSSAYYAGMHGPGIIVFLVWLFLRHPDRFGRWRNALALLTGMSLFIRFIQVAPPRHIPELGFIDVSVIHGMDVYGPIGTGVSAQFVAMPSLHVAWAAVVGFGVISVSTSRWRWLFACHLPITAFVVSATGHHWWLDGIVAVVLLGVALAIDSAARRVLASRGRSTQSSPAGPEPVSVVQT